MRRLSREDVTDLAGKLRADESLIWIREEIVPDELDLHITFGEWLFHLEVMELLGAAT